MKFEFEIKIFQFYYKLLSKYERFKQKFIECITVNK